MSQERETGKLLGTRGDNSILFFSCQVTTKIQILSGEKSENRC